MSGCSLIPGLLLAGGAPGPPGPPACAPLTAVWWKRLDCCFDQQSEEDQQDLVDHESPSSGTGLVPAGCCNKWTGLPESPQWSLGAEAWMGIEPMIFGLRDQRLPTWPPRLQPGPPAAPAGGKVNVVMVQFPLVTSRGPPHFTHP